MKQQIVPKFAHLQYQVLHNLDISINEYFLLDMIHYLSGNGKTWCNKKLNNIAFDMRLSQRGVIKLRNRLIGRKLLIKGIGNRLKTSEKLNKVYFLEETELQKTELSSQKLNLVQPKTELSVSKTSVESYKRLTLEKGNQKNIEGPGYAKARAIRETFKRRISVRA